MAKKKDEQPPSFEETLAILEQLVETMEQGDISLEESMAAFEKGIGLTRRAQQALAEAEQQVQLLMEQDGEPVAQPFSDEEEEPS
jgi:exodeoxyribonuclease VII small subunit